MPRNNKILFRRKGDATGAPSAGDLEYGELVLNYNSGSKKIYFNNPKKASTCLKREWAF